MAKRISKAEQERRSYIDQTAKRVAGEVMAMLSSEELDRMREEIRFQDSQSYRNQGALQLAEILCDLEPGEVTWVIHQVKEVGRKGGFNCVRVHHRDVYPLPPR